MTFHPTSTAVETTTHPSFGYWFDIPNGLESWNEKLSWVYDCVSIIA